jgi:hypothetical protein
MMKGSASTSKVLHHHRTHDDGLSRATEKTDESLSPPPSPDILRAKHHTQSWRRGATPSSSSSRSSYPQLQQQQQQQHQSHYLQYQQELQESNTLQRRDSDPGYPTKKTLDQQKSDPVKCPPRKTQSVCDEGYHKQRTSSISPNGDDDKNHGMDVSYLERMYDSRTWEMYRRITEARRQSKCSNAEGTKADPTSSSLQRFQRMTTNGNGGITRHHQQRQYVGEDTSEWENLQYEEEETSSDGEHNEMIFLFDF